MNVAAVSLPWDVGARAETTRLLASSALKIAHNAPYDILNLERHGIVTRGPIWCTMLAQQVIDPDAPSYALNEVASFWLDVRRWKHLGNPSSRPKPSKTKVWKRAFVCAGCGFEGLSGAGVKDARKCGSCVVKADEAAANKWDLDSVTYNRQDTAVLLPIQAAQERALRATGQHELFVTMMDALEHVLIPMMAAGVAVDTRVRDRIAERYAESSARARRRFDRMAPGVNPASVPQLAELMYDTWGLAPIDGRSTSVDAIRSQIGWADRSTAFGALVSRALSTVLALRRASKWGATYAAIGDRVYPAYTPSTKDSADGGRRFGGIAATGRILAKGDRRTRTPPIQQIPKRLRGLFVPDSEEACFVSFDYDSQELRLLAAHSGDETLNAQLAEGRDIHSENMRAWGCSRVLAKNLFYGGVAYGAGARTLQRTLAKAGVRMSLAEAEGFVHAGRRTYPGVRAWQVAVVAAAKRDGFVANSFGRRRPVIDADRMYNEIINTPIQGDGADMLWTRLRAMDQCARMHASHIRILVHDGFVFEVPRARVDAFVADMRDVLQAPFENIAPGWWCPVSVEVGPSWGDLEPYARAA